MKWRFLVFVLLFSMQADSQSGYTETPKNYLTGGAGLSILSVSGEPYYYQFPGAFLGYGRVIAENKWLRLDAGARLGYFGYERPLVCICLDFFYYPNRIRYETLWLEIPVTARYTIPLDNQSFQPFIGAGMSVRKGIVERTTYWFDYSDLLPEPLYNSIIHDIYAWDLAFIGSVGVDYQTKSGRTWSFEAVHNQKIKAPRMTDYGLSNSAWGQLTLGASYYFNGGGGRKSVAGE